MPLDYAYIAYYLYAPQMPGSYAPQMPGLPFVFIRYIYQSFQFKIGKFVVCKVLGDFRAQNLFFID